MVESLGVRQLRVAIDMAFILLFVSLGRSTHDHGVTVAGMASTTWPFAVGLGVAWLALLSVHRTGVTLMDGSFIVVVIVVVGMALRALTGQGIALAFIFVASAFLGLFLLGWRLLYQAFSRSAMGD